jgi:muramoyltetrapeptide carboxypeptidase
MTARLFPQNIKKTAVIPIASDAEPQRVAEALDFIKREGVEVVYPKERFSGFDERAHFLQEIFMDESVDLIIAERGGYGSAEVCEALNWKKLNGVAKPLLGYSDITFLHFAMLKYNCGIPVSGPVAVELPAIAKNPVSLSAFYNTLENLGKVSENEIADIGQYRLSPDDEFEIMKQGRVTAPVIPGNLTVLTTVIGTDYMPDLSGKILLVEDIAEPPYKIRRCLNHLKQSGLLAKLSGLIYGNFRKCGNPAELKEIFQLFAEEINGPVISNFRFGHCLYSFTMQTGKNFQLDTNNL